MKRWKSYSFSDRRFPAGILFGIERDEGAMPTVTQGSVCGFKLVKRTRPNVADYVPDFTEEVQSE